MITEPAQFLDQGLKPDIEAHVVPGYDSPITFDIRITQPATSLRKDPRNALNHLRANEKQKNDLYSRPMSENGFMFMLSFLSRSETRYQKFAALCSKFIKIIAVIEVSLMKSQQ